VSDKLAIIAAKLSARAIRAIGAGLGSNLPGRLARSVSPGVLAKLTSQCRRGVLAVSGTNGKSTTSGLIFSILQRAGLKAAHNRQGANLVTGITASLIEASDWDGHIDVDYCLFEVDEASLPVVAAEVELSAVVVTNLFRDQLDRFGELDTTARLINEGMQRYRSRAVLNADDPNVAQLGQDCQRTFYGIQSLSEQSRAPQSKGPLELSYCAQCGREYDYSLVFYGQLGHYNCPACGHARPVPDVSAQEVNVQHNRSTFLLMVGDEAVRVNLPLPGLFNVYNALAAAALAYRLGIPAVTIEDGLTNYVTLFGRSERLTIEGKSVLIQLIKNPAGASQVVSSLVNDQSARVLIAINDNLADGRDVSWLWDADFELLADHTKPILVSGQRAQDMAVRMKYAGLPADQIIVVPALAQALRQVLAATGPEETLWVLPTYTCLLELQKILKSMGYTLSGT